MFKLKVILTMLIRIAVFYTFNYLPGIELGRNKTDCFIPENRLKNFVNASINIGYTET